MAIYTTSHSNSSNFRERISEIRDLMHPETIPKHRRSDEDRIRAERKKEQSQELYKESITKKKFLNTQDEKAPAYYDEKTLKKLD